MVLGIGEYPAGYNANVHGPYDPARYYGKVDTPLSQTKIGEILPWLKRRDYNPVSMARAVGRGFWKWNQTWMLPKKAGIAGAVQAVMAVSLWYYVNQYPHLKYHRHTKYH